jgi:quinolinate synthase
LTVSSADAEVDLAIYEEIEDLKRREDATILAHYYQDGAIQEIADITGDSLKLARAATGVNSKTIVFCGVHFMAETAKILNPEKRVLLPDMLAGCSLADGCPADRLARFQTELRNRGRRFDTVTYINSSADVKAISDWIVTSGNAIEIVRDRVPSDREILFVPDRHLGKYVEEATGRKLILWDGACVVHEVFSVSELLKTRRRLANSITIAHPECPVNIREQADFVGGTEAMLNYVDSIESSTDILVATEANMLWRLQNNVPRHRYHPVPGVTCACNTCPHMARNTLEKVRDCLRTGAPEIAWRDAFDRAAAVLRRSLLG